MNEMKELLVERKKYLEDVIASKQRAIKENECMGRIYANKHNKGFQYYLKEDSGIRYIKASDKKLVQKAIQNEYDRKVLIAAEKEYKKLKDLINIYNKNDIEKIYNEMPISKKVMIDPIELTDEEYICWWNGQNYQTLGFRDNSPEFYSDKGERMRSKSEVLIANMLNKLNIIYKYEKELKLNRIGIVHPDFTLLNVKERKEIYWEHLGMLDDTVYRNNAISKIRDYERSGYFLGDKLIVTGESLNCPLDLRVVEKKIKFIMGM